MTRTPDEIKKGLEVCNIWMIDEPNHCMECPYFRTKDCADTLMKRALTLIQQLQAENAGKDARIQQLESDKQQLEGLLTHMNQLRDAAAGRALQMEESVHQLEAERDAAVADILYAASVYLGECNTCKNGEVCAACKRQDACDECPNSKCMCSGCGAGRSNWQWRGVQKEDSDA